MQKQKHNMEWFYLDNNKIFFSFSENLVINTFNKFCL